MKQSFSYSIKLSKVYNSINVSESIEEEVTNEADWEKKKQELILRVESLAEIKVKELGTKDIVLPKI